MRVKVLFFGVLKDILSSESQTLDLPRDSTVETLLLHYRQLSTKAQALWPVLAVAVNRQYASPAVALKDGDEVALLPPVSGGSGTAPAKAQATRVALVRGRIDAEEVVASLKAGEDGAVVIFDGIVRNHTRGRRTLFLVYEAYESMALELMNSLALDAIVHRKVRDVAIIHRLGRLEIGESSVLIAVASEHRAQAFDACRWLIDTLKKTVPIWKKEYFEDGAIWADGEPFPPELAEKGGLES
jgi:MoaE-MoaD fusion protein